MKISTIIPAEILAKIPPFPARKAEKCTKTKLLLLKTDTKNPLLKRIKVNYGKL